MNALICNFILQDDGLPRLFDDPAPVETLQDKEVCY